MTDNVVPLAQSRLWTQTFTGQQFFFHSPETHKYNLRDIGQALSQICRFGGASTFHYSVAQHSILMADKMYEIHKSSALALDCLFHDAAEAYVGDMKKPIKVQIPKFGEIEGRIDRAIRRRFGLLGLIQPENALTKEYDMRIISDERRQVMQACDHDWFLGDFDPLGVNIVSHNPLDMRETWLQRVHLHSGLLVNDGTHAALWKELF